MRLKKVVRAAAVSIALVTLGGCGSNSAGVAAGPGTGVSGGSGNGSGSGGSETIKGVATPESVAVVTATNTN
jgi:hypothetical protein